jgi:hypothetical protein
MAPHDGVLLTHLIHHCREFGKLCDEAATAAFMRWLTERAAQVCRALSSFSASIPVRDGYQVNRDRQHSVQGSRTVPLPSNATSTFQVVLSKDSAILPIYSSGGRLLSHAPCWHCHPSVEAWVEAWVIQHTLATLPSTAPYWLPGVEGQAFNFLSGCDADF